MSSGVESSGRPTLIVPMDLGIPSKALAVALMSVNSRPGMECRDCTATSVKPSAAMSARAWAGERFCTPSPAILSRMILEE